MFTGLICDIGEIVGVSRPPGGDLVAKIKTRMPPSHLTLGASVACSGVCLTVVSNEGDTFTVQASSETLARTKIGSWDIGTKINLEPSLRMGDELGGHLVTGHVDGVARVLSLETDRDSRRLRLSLPSDLRHLVAVKGSIAIDGVSLTINAINDDDINIMIIPHTWAHTTFMDLKQGDRLHVEVDMFARYIDRILKERGL